MALACEDSRMSMDSDLSNLSPCKPMIAAANNNKASTLSSPERRPPVITVTEASPSIAEISHNGEDQKKQTPPTSKQAGCSRPSWVDIVEEEEQITATGLKNSEQKNEDESNVATTPAPELIGTDTKMSMDDSNSNTSLRSSGSGRQIEIDILDSANVEKYEKLVRDEKIKSPFKRRLSGGGEDGDEADGDDDGHAKFVDPEPGTDEGLISHHHQQQHKKTKLSEDDHGRERFRRESSSSSGDSSSQSSRKPMEFEKDASILERRQKQIDYGKNTLGYENYCKEVPREERTKDHPKTPPKHIKYSRRAWDGLVKVWRKQLHCFDPDASDAPDAKPETDDKAKAKAK